MLLKEYIKEVGDKSAAEAIGVKPRTTKSWRLGQRMPSHENAKDIVKKLNGLVSYGECYGQPK